MIDQLTILFAVIGLIGLLLYGWFFYKGWFSDKEQANPKQRDEFELQTLKCVS